MCCEFVEGIMKLVRSCSKKTFQFSAAMRNASFSKGWLHLAVQGFFAVFTVASFILIVIMAMPTSVPEIEPIPERTSRCHSKLRSCFVSCTDVPYFGEREEDIIFTVSQLPEECTSFELSLLNPMFKNESLSPHWLPRLRLPIHELTINGGNLHYLPRDSFMTPTAFTIRSLVLLDLTIIRWSRDSFVGLSSLASLFVKNCHIVHVQTNFFRAVRDTITHIAITKSNKWIPSNVTGTTPLRRIISVDFSHNNFQGVLDANSFIGIRDCRTLYLHHCKITTIPRDIFNSFVSIESIFLNDNELVSIPAGLFDNIVPIKPKINLQDNFWFCDCSLQQIRDLVTLDMLLTEVTCHSPDRYKHFTFYDFDKSCTGEFYNIETESASDGVATRQPINGVAYINDGCHKGEQNYSSEILKMLSPLYDHPCSSTEIARSILRSSTSLRRNSHSEEHDNWIQFAFFLMTGKNSMVQITTTESSDYGLFWYQSSCPNEAYCVNVVPDNLRVYNVDLNAEYIFCPVQINTGLVQSDRCVLYNITEINQLVLENKLQYLLYLSTGGICLVVGALFVYTVVHRYPNLLKGSKRILFVKHQNVNALVLPPKVPVRNSLSNETVSEENKKKIFIMPGNDVKPATKINRTKSTRSTKSNAPSYISALQPTDDQLAQWRIQNHFANDMTSDLSWMDGTDSMNYIDIIDNEKYYESIK